MSTSKSLTVGAALTLLLAAVSTSSTFAETVQKGEVTIEAPWARASIGTARPAVAYLTIRNGGSQTEKLTSVKASISGMAEVHKSTLTDGVARMGPVGGLEIPAGTEVKLKPGGLHIMLMKLKYPLKEGKKFTLALIFKGAKSIDVSVPILGIGASGPAK
jgi:copper(I)-binding protein